METLSQKYSHEALLQSEQSHRDRLCCELTKLFKTTLGEKNKTEEEPERKSKKSHFLSQLKDLGHKLELWDFSDNIEVWIHDYGNSAAFGLMVDINYEEGSEIYWHDPRKHNPAENRPDGALKKIVRRVWQKLKRKPANGPTAGAVNDQDFLNRSKDAGDRGIGHEQVLRITSGQYEFVPEKGGWIHRKHLEVIDFDLVRRRIKT